MAETESLSYIGKSSRTTIPFESQLLSACGGFVIFVALIAFLATIHNRRKRRASRSDFHAPLIHHSNLGSLKSIVSNGNAKGRGFSVQPASVTPRQTPSPSCNSLHSGSDSSGASPQCTPLTPYSTGFSVTQYDPYQHHLQHHYQQQHNMFPYINTGQTPVVPQQPPRRLRSNSCASGSSAGSAATPLPPFIQSDNRGSISLQLSYDATSKALQVTILACHDLPELSGDNACGMSADIGASQLNPYVKLRILPENQHRVKTRVLRGTKNPFYDETFTMYGINENNVKGYSLHLAVLAFDPYNHDLILGENVYNLSQLDLANNCQKLSTTLKLKARENLDENRGQVLISMAYNQQSNSINFAVLKMKDLPKDNSIGLLDPYAKIYMTLNGERRVKQKTHVKKKTRDPIFNESFSFDLVNIKEFTTLDHVGFHVNVLNHDGVTRNELIGHCAIGADTAQFAQCRSTPGQQVAEWYPILA